MKNSLALVYILVSMMPAVYAQTNSDEIQRLQKLAKENEDRAIRAETAAKYAEADAKNKRYLAASLEMADRSIEIRDSELSALLAVQACSFNTQYGGYSFNSKIYNALFNSLRKI